MLECCRFLRTKSSGTPLGRSSHKLEEEQIAANEKDQLHKSGVNCVKLMYVVNFCTKIGRD